MEESILKAISLDAFEPGQKCSSIVDDVFFIVRKSIRYDQISIEKQKKTNLLKNINIFFQIDVQLKHSRLMVFVQ